MQYDVLVSYYINITDSERRLEASSVAVDLMSYSNDDDKDMWTCDMTC